jgi:hypothetical protein
VVLPAPFRPMKPKSWPRSIGEAQVVDGDAAVRTACAGRGSRSRAVPRVVNSSLADHSASASGARARLPAA